MTGERMETVRIVLRATRGLTPFDDAALAEVERWERDRARLEAIERAARDLLANVPLPLDPTRDDLDRIVALDRALGDGRRCCGDPGDCGEDCQ